MIETAPEPVLKLSWSRIRLHQECQRKGALVAAGQKSPVADVRNYFHGNVVDLAMRRWLALPDPPAGWMAAHVDEMFGEAEVAAGQEGMLKWRDAGDKARVRAWCLELVIRLEPILFELVIPHEYQPAWRFEAQMTIPGLDGRPRRIALRGEMDLFTRHRVTAATSVLDLKGTENTSYWRQVSGQLVFYEIAAKIMTGVWPEVSRIIQPMCPERVLPFWFSEDDRRQMLGVICAVAADIWRGQLPPKPDSAGCNRCEVKAACPKFARSRGRVPLGT